MPARLTKLAATALSALLFATNSALAYAPEVNFWRERRKTAQQRQQYVFLSPQNPKQFSIPQIQNSFDLGHSNLEFHLGFGFRHLDLEKYGTIRKIANPQSQNPKSKTIIHIQDIHLNPEAQSNIGKTIQQLIREGRVNLVALEGAFGPLDLKTIHRFPYQDAVQAAADYFLEEKKLSGAMRAALTAKAPLVVGVDDPRHYRANVEAYRKSLPLVPAYKRRLSELEKKLDQEKQAVFTPELMAFDTRRQAYQKGEVGLGNYLKGLAGPTAHGETGLFLEALDLESALDLSAVDRERTALLNRLMPKLSQREIAQLTRQSAAHRLGRVKAAGFYDGLVSLCQLHGISLSHFPFFNAYRRYVLLSEQIDAERLLNEVKHLEENLLNSLVKKPEERALLDALRRLYLVGKLLDFALIKEEWEEYRTSFSVLRPSSKEDNLRIGDLASFEAFYQEAEIRDEKMARNFIDHLPRTKNEVRSTKDVSILVTGGFHAKGIEKRLTEAGLAVVNFVPKITEVKTEDGAAYLSAFTQEKTPLEKLFEGDKLFVSPEQWANPRPFKFVTAVTAAYLHKKDLESMAGLLELRLPKDLEPKQEGSRFILKRPIREALFGPAGRLFHAVAAYKGKKIEAISIASSPVLKFWEQKRFIRWAGVLIAVLNMGAAWPYVGTPMIILAILGSVSIILGGIAYVVLSKVERSLSPRSFAEALQALNGASTKPLSRLREFLGARYMRNNRNSITIERLALLADTLALRHLASVRSQRIIADVISSKLAELETEIKRQSELLFQEERDFIRRAITNALQNGSITDEPAASALGRGLQLLNQMDHLIPEADSPMSRAEELRQRNTLRRAAAKAAVLFTLGIVLNAAGLKGFFYWLDLASPASLTSLAVLMVIGGVHVAIGLYFNFRSQVDALRNEYSGAGPYLLSFEERNDLAKGAAVWAFLSALPFIGSLWLYWRVWTSGLFPVLLIMTSVTGLYYLAFRRLRRVAELSLERRLQEEGPRAPVNREPPPPEDPLQAMVYEVWRDLAAARGVRPTRSALIEHVVACRSTHPHLFPAGSDPVRLIDQAIGGIIDDRRSPAVLAMEPYEGDFADVVVLYRLFMRYFAVYDLQSFREFEQKEFQTILKEADHNLDWASGVANNPRYESALESYSRIDSGFKGLLKKLRKNPGPDSQPPVLALEGVFSAAAITVAALLFLVVGILYWRSDAFCHKANMFFLRRGLLRAPPDEPLPDPHQRHYRLAARALLSGLFQPLVLIRPSASAVRDLKGEYNRFQISDEETLVCKKMGNVEVGFSIKRVGPRTMEVKATLSVGSSAPLVTGSYTLHDAVAVDIEQRRPASETPPDYEFVDFRVTPVTRDGRAMPLRSLSFMYQYTSTSGPVLFEPSDTQISYQTLNDLEDHLNADHRDVYFRLVDSAVLLSIRQNNFAALIQVSRANPQLLDDYLYLRGDLFSLALQNPEMRWALDLMISVLLENPPQRNASDPIEIADIERCLRSPQDREDLVQLVDLFIQGRGRIETEWRNLLQLHHPMEEALFMQVQAAVDRIQGMGRPLSPFVALFMEEWKRHSTLPEIGVIPPASHPVLDTRRWWLRLFMSPADIPHDVVGHVWWGRLFGIRSVWRPEQGQVEVLWIPPSGQYLRSRQMAHGGIAVNLILLQAGLYLSLIFLANLLQEFSPYLLIGLVLSSWVAVANVIGLISIPFDRSPAADWRKWFPQSWQSVPIDYRYHRMPQRRRQPRHYNRILQQVEIIENWQAGTRPHREASDELVRLARHLRDFPQIQRAIRDRIVGAMTENRQRGAPGEGRWRVTPARVTDGVAQIRLFLTLLQTGINQDQLERLYVSMGLSRAIRNNQVQRAIALYTSLRFFQGQPFSLDLAIERAWGRSGASSMVFAHLLNPSLSSARHRARRIFRYWLNYIGPLAWDTRTPEGRVRAQHEIRRYRHNFNGLMGEFESNRVVMFTPPGRMMDVVYWVTESDGNLIFFRFAPAQWAENAGADDHILRELEALGDSAYPRTITEEGEPLVFSAYAVDLDDDQAVARLYAAGVPPFIEQEQDEEEEDEVERHRASAGSDNLTAAPLTLDDIRARFEARQGIGIQFSHELHDEEWRLFAMMVQRDHDNRDEFAAVPNLHNALPLLRQRIITMARERGGNIAHEVQTVLLRLIILSTEVTGAASGLSLEDLPACFFSERDQTILRLRMHRFIDPSGRDPLIPVTSEDLPFVRDNHDGALFVLRILLDWCSSRDLPIDNRVWEFWWQWEQQANLAEAGLPVPRALKMLYSLSLVDQAAQDLMSEEGDHPNRLDNLSIPWSVFSGLVFFMIAGVLIKGFGFSHESAAVLLSLYIGAYLVLVQGLWLFVGSDDVRDSKKILFGQEKGYKLIPALGDRPERLTAATNEQEKRQILKKARVLTIGSLSGIIPNAKLDELYDRVPRMAVWDVQFEKDGPFRSVILVNEMNADPLTQAMGFPHEVAHLLLGAFLPRPVREFLACALGALLAPPLFFFWLLPRFFHVKRDEKLGLDWKYQLQVAQTFWEELVYSAWMVALPSFLAGWIGSEAYQFPVELIFGVISVLLFSYHPYVYRWKSLASVLSEITWESSNDAGTLRVGLITTKTKAGERFIESIRRADPSFIEMKRAMALYFGEGDGPLVPVGMVAFRSDRRLVVRFLKGARSPALERALIDALEDLAKITGATDVRIDDTVLDIDLDVEFSDERTPLTKVRRIRAGESEAIEQLKLEIRTGILDPETLLEFNAEDDDADFSRVVAQIDHMLQEAGYQLPSSQKHAILNRYGPKLVRATLRDWIQLGVGRIIFTAIFLLVLKTPLIGNYLNYVLAFVTVWGVHKLWQRAVPLLNHPGLPAWLQIPYAAMAVRPAPSTPEHHRIMALQTKASKAGLDQFGLSPETMASKGPARRQKKKAKHRIDALLGRPERRPLDKIRFLRLERRSS